MEVNHIPGYVVIMAGGVGSRFWPSSTEERPKQFLDILGVGKSLLRMTYERCLKFVKNENIIVITNSRYFGLVKNEIPEMEENNILLEPSRNNTAPCLAYACLRIRAMEGNAVFAVLPSDHVILKEEEFASLMKKSMDYARKHEAIVTLGISPTRPDTGYGYIRMSNEGDLPYKVRAFVEKPNTEKAAAYLASGEYLWNAGIFIWSTSTLLQAFASHEPGILEILDAQPAVYNTPGEQAFIDMVYPSTKNISIDFAVLEKADNVYTLPADIGWSDLGTWGSLYDYQEKSTSGNVEQLRGDHYLEDVENCLIRTQTQKRVIIRGIKGLVVVDEQDALLIYPIDKEQEIKNAIPKLGENKK